MSCWVFLEDNCPPKIQHGRILIAFAIEYLACLHDFKHSLPLCFKSNHPPFYESLPILTFLSFGCDVMYKWIKSIAGFFSSLKTTQPPHQNNVDILQISLICDHLSLSHMCRYKVNNTTDYVIVWFWIWWRHCFIAKLQIWFRTRA